MKSLAKVALCGVGLGLVLTACGDDSTALTSPLGPDTSEVSSDSNGGVGVLSSAMGSVPGLSSAVVATSATTPGQSSPAQPTSSAGRAAPGSSASAPTSSAAIPPASSATTVIPHFEGNSPIFFSEVSPMNANFKDNDGNDPGWVEFYNSSDKPVDLKGYALTNDLSDARRWVFGNVKVPAKSYLIVFLSGKNYPDYILPSDSLNMMSSDCSSESAAGSGGFNFPGMGGDWGGGMPGMGGNPGGGAGGNTSGNNVENLQGKSSLCFNEGGANQAGAVMKVAQGGSYSRVVVKTGNASKLSKVNQLVVRGFITKNHKIRVNFKEGDSLSNWSGKNLRGTGDLSSVYYVRLEDNAKDLNRNKVTATTFATETQGSESTTIQITSYVARNRGHEPHASFKVGKDGGALYFINAENAMLDSVRFGAVPTNASWSRDGAGKWGFATPSPYGNTSGEVFAEQVQVAEVNIPPSGFYSSAVTVTFPAGTRCEQGGKEPTANSPAAQTTMNISSTTVLRCRTYSSGSYPSEEINRTYVFEQQPSLAAIFVTTDPLSMFSPDSGLYMTGNGAAMMDPKKGANFWSNRELQVYVEMFEPGKPKTPAFGIMGDYKITGQYSRAKEKKSFAITLREEYGDKRLKYPLFPDHPELTKFKAFSLRNFGNNSGDDYLRDRLGTSMTDGLGVDYQRGRYVIVYYNGKYYGIHDLRERNNEYYYETKYGYDPNDIDLLETSASGTDEASTGSSADYKAMIEWLRSNSLSSDANYKKVADQIDIDNYINYMQAEMFLNNSDWPHNNIKKWRVASQKTKWKWFLYDTDFGFGVSYNTQNGNVFSYVTNENGTNGMGGFNFGDFGGGMGGDFGGGMGGDFPGMGGGNWGGGMGGQQPQMAVGASTSVHTILMIRLLENEGFKNAFINRFSVLLSMNFSAERLLKRINELQSQVESEMARDQQFWNYNASSMSNNLQTIKNFAQSRQATVREQMESHFSLSSPVEMTISSQGSGTVLVDGLPLDQSSMRLTFYTGVSVTLTARAGSGATFTGWSDGVTDATRKVNPGEVTSLTAVFK
ncbi:CotH kinase family protein [Fibrobacter sp.]|uniref:CotH kinase family protein n=1 Tax=Fibrobacter sp. TaxID=35828 RepID=UPI0025BD4663|nr:CotH kinase family protein [Fibrobacter sp.]